MRKPDLSKLSFATGVPTMIVPPGTQIQVDAQGQVSIRTPGNLVLQNSGSYAILESVSGSIRIEPSVRIEAVTVRCADTCFVQGTLTAWRVVARTLHVDNDGEAQVVMQETEHLEVGRHGRLVGNFRSENELFQLFSRFSGHLRALPAPLPGTAVEPALEGELAGPAEAAVDVTPEPEPAAAASSVAAPATTRLPLPDALYLALQLIEQDPEPEARPASRLRARNQLLGLLREGDVDTLRHTYKTLFARLNGDGEGVLRARRLVGAFFDAEGGSPRAPDVAGEAGS